MSWALYRVTWRLESPLHIGFAKLGNVQRTRLYVTGRIFWGALTARLTREQSNRDYLRVGKVINQHLVFSYGYLSLTANGTQPLLPCYTTTGLKFSINGSEWTEREIQRFCLTSYASTALNYQSNTDKEGSLHEVEFISPRALCSLNSVCVGAPLYLTAYVAASDTANNTPEVQGWKTALSKMQIGGERTYGFGHIALVNGPTLSNDWWGNIVVLDKTLPEVIIDANRSLLAHVDASRLLPVDIEQGSIEPLLGRDTTPQAAFGKDINSMGVYWQPGTIVKNTIQCQIMPAGFWRTL